MNTSFPEWMRDDAQTVLRFCADIICGGATRCDARALPPSRQPLVFTLRLITGTSSYWGAFGGLIFQNIGVLYANCFQLDSGRKLKYSRPDLTATRIEQEWVLGRMREMHVKPSGKQLKP